MRTPSLIALSMVAFGCGAGELALGVGADEELTLEAPLLGSGGKDEADRSCHIVLRELGRRPGPSGGYETDCTAGVCSYVWSGTLDLSVQAVAEAAKPYVLYQSGSSTRWLQVIPTRTSGAPAGYQRYSFRMKKGTVSAGASTTSLMNTRIQVAPFLKTASKARLFDHNRLPGALDNYLLGSANGWAISDDPVTCRPAAPRTATVEFLPGWRQVQHGALVAGGKLRLEYDLNRLGTCRGTHNGHPAWDVRASVRFLPGGQMLEGSVRGFDAPLGVPQGAGVPLPFEAAIPVGATRAEVWFKNFTGAGSSCVAWDSNDGQNYSFEVVNAPAPVGWAGNFGGSFSRACDSQVGLAEPLVLDSYIQQRACTFVDAEVWVPGLTDVPGEHPERLLAQVEASFDGRPAVLAWLSFEGKVGNDYRFRWQLPRQTLTSEYWNTLRYTFRFSTDGTSWYRIGQGSGPGGGVPRTLERDPSWCSPSWANCGR